MFEYFYSGEPRQYAFYCIPQLLFTDNHFKDISCEAKLLYAFLLDRAALSQKNGWVDEDNKVYVYFTLDELCERLNIACQKAVKVFSELDVDKGIGLIRRKKQGQGKPTKIYVMNFTKYIESSGTDFQTCENHKSETKSQVKSCENHKSRLSEITSQDFTKSQVLYNNQTDRNRLIESDQSYLSAKTDVIDTMEKDRSYYQALVRKNINYDFTEEKETVDKIAEVMIDVICSKKEYIRVNGENFPQKVVKERFLSITAKHIDYVITSLKKSAKKIRNIRAYLITALYNAPTTFDSICNTAENVKKAENSSSSFDMEDVMSQIQNRYRMTAVQ